MTDFTGSQSDFIPQEVIDRIDIHLLRIEIMKKEAKDEWLKKKREKGKMEGFPFFKKRVEYTEEELEHLWTYGNEGSWIWDTPKYIIWNWLNEAERKLKRIRDFCQLSTDNGNNKVTLSLEDALFAFNWK